MIDPRDLDTLGLLREILCELQCSRIEATERHIAAIAAIIAAERERCAKIAESFAAPETVAQIDYDEACHDIAEAIRKGT